MTAFDHLLSPGRIGRLELPNRIVMPAMDMNLSDDGEVTEREIEHYVARARGGTGLVITGAGAVAFPVGAASRHQPGWSDDRFIPGLRRLTEAVHGAGGRVCAQLCHHGKTSNADTADGRELLVPSLPQPDLDLSPLRNCLPAELAALARSTQGKRATYRVADDHDLGWVVERFVDAAVRAKAAGFDAIEMHAAHGYLLSAFLSAGYNRRTDAWGGPIEHRARLVCDVVRQIRNALGDGMPIIVRINGHEHGPAGGLTAVEAAAAAALIEAAGADALHVSANAHDPFTDFTLGPLPAEPGQYREYARTVKAAVSVPVIAVGRLLPELAEEMLAAGECDFVAMGRQLLADPLLAEKLTRGRRHSIRPCINCYVCVEQNFFDDTPRCAVNPALGHEELTHLPPASPARRIVVVGGGPAGMEVARLAARRGHLVTLVERSARLGGTAWFSQLTTPANEALVRWLAGELQEAGVELLVGQDASVPLVRDLSPDVVVVATGAHKARPAIPGADLPHVHTGDDLRALITGDARTSGGRSLFDRAALAVGRALRLTDEPERIRTLSKRWMPVGKDVVVLGGGLVGLELAEFLAERGRSVTVLEEGPVLGLPMAMPRRWRAVQRAADHGVALHAGAEVVEILAGAVLARIEGDVVTVPADDVVVAGHVRPDPTLADELRAAGFDVRVVGDAADVGYLEGAIHSADRVARTL